MLYRKMFICLLLAVFISMNTVKADAISNMEENLNMSISDIIIIIVSLGLIILTALDARIALMIAFLLYGSLFIVFTLATEEGYSGFNPYYSGVAMMTCFVIICISLLITYKKSNTPYNVV